MNGKKFTYGWCAPLKNAFAYYLKGSIKRRYSNKRRTFTENNLLSAALEFCAAALIWVLTD